MDLSNFKKRMNKKGQMHNYLAVMIVLFVFGFMSIFGAYYLSELIDGFTTAGYYTEPATIEAGEGFINASHMMDYIIVIIMTILIIGVGVTSYKLASSAIFFIISFVMAAFLGFIGYFFSYVFAQIVSQPVFVATLFFFPRTLLVCGNLHWVGLACLIIGSITLYAKRQREVGLIK